MLSDERKQEIQREAALRAQALDDELLRHETARLAAEENECPPGDSQEALRVRAWAYSAEMGKRKLSER